MTTDGVSYNDIYTSKEFVIREMAILSLLTRVRQATGLYLLVMAHEARIIQVPEASDDGESHITVITYPSGDWKASIVDVLREFITRVIDRLAVSAEIGVKSTREARVMIDRLNLIYQHVSRGVVTT